MLFRSALTLLAMATAPLAAQQSPRDFDYLLGDWRFSGSREDSPLRGLWTAVRLPGGQILDEFRVFTEDGKTRYVATTLRNYDGWQRRWDLVSAEEFSGVKDFGTAKRVGDEMHIEQQFGVGGDQPSIWRIRYYDIREDHFRWEAARSLDNGKTWVAGYMRLEVERIGPPRELALTGSAR